MHVKCPQCATIYNLDESKISAQGSKVRCSRCTTIFTVFPATEPAPQPPAPTPEPARQSLDDFEEELAALTQQQPAAAPQKSPVDQDMLNDLQGAFQQPLIGQDGDDPDLDHQPSVKKSSTLRPLLLVVLLILSLVLGGIYYFKPSLLGIKVQPPGNNQTPSTTRGEGVANIALENVRQYFVPNEKEGQLFIIEGQAVNRFEEPRELIRLKASLFDHQGQEIITDEFMCGNVVSLYQLQVSSRQEIESALSAKVGILTNNTNIQPGASVPFMIVFFGAPEIVEEFGLEVVQASRPGS